MTSNKFYSLIGFMVLVPLMAQAQRATPNNWKCNDRISGTWVFGTAPHACSVTPFISDKIVADKFSHYTFLESATRNPERERYVNELHHLLLEASEYYLKKRKPNVSQTELRWWKRAILAIAHQESFFTHYRKGRDGKLRMMRGDFGHGHGLMQVDDRWHFVAVQEGTAAHLLQNLFYGLDVFYAAWERAPRQSCVGSATNYYSRVRAAYSAYNGGPNRICRWTDPNNRWARNDRNFKDKLDQQQWERYLASNFNPQPTDISCLLNDGGECSDPTPPPTTPPTNEIDEITAKKVLKYQDYYCSIREDDSYHCIAQSKYRFCLVSHFELVNEVVAVNTEKPVVLLEPGDICPSNADSDKFHKIGTRVKIQKNINMRRTPGGRWVQVAKKNETYQVLDVVIGNQTTGSRYYQIKKGSRTGYIYGGNYKSASEWTVALEENNSDIDPSLPQPGSEVTIAMRRGINLRSTPGGRRIAAIPQGVQVEVLDTVIAGNTNKVYLEVIYRGRRGYLYAGQTAPLFTVDRWIRVE